MTTLLELSVPAPRPGPADWNDRGVEYLPELLDPDDITAYEDAWIAANGFRGVRQAHPLGEGEGVWEDRPGASTNPAGLYVIDADRPGGWPDACPYMRQPALLDLCMSGALAEALERLVGEPMGLHLNLTGWTSTQRNWHQDGYLNPDPVGDFYAAVWLALGDVHADAGPFEFVPGSHRWHRLLQSKVFASGIIDPSDPGWPTHTEAILTDLVDAEIAERDAEVERYMPNARDALIWHPRLYHRGTAPQVPNAYRPALIAHFSGIYHRPDMPEPVQHSRGGWYFPIITQQPVAP